MEVVAVIATAIVGILSLPEVKFYIVYGCVLWVMHMTIKGAVVAALKKAQREGYLSRFRGTR